MTSELRTLLLEGPGPNNPPSKLNVVKYGGSAVILCAWRRHRQELLDSCPIGFRCWAYWAVELGLKPTPLGEVAQLRVIRARQLYKDAAEKAFVIRRLAKITRGRRAFRGAACAVA